MKLGEPDKIAFEIDNPDDLSFDEAKEKREQELLPLRKCDDFFRKMIIVGGYAPMHYTSDGIIEVGVIPFLLDTSILDKALAD